MQGRSATGADQAFPHQMLHLQSVRLRPGPGGLLHKERGLSVYPGLPEDVWDTVPRLWGVRGGRGGNCPGQDLPPQLLRLYNLQAPISTRRPSHIQRERLSLSALCTADVFQP